MQKSDNLRHQFTLFLKISHRKQKLLLATCSVIILNLLLLDWSFVRYRLLDESIAPAFWGGQKVVTLRWAYLLTSPQRQDMIIYSQAGRFLPGKIVAVPGDHVAFSKGVIFLNGTPLHDTGGLTYENASPAEISVPKGFVGVIDNPGRFKLVAIKNIKGKILGNWQVLII